MGLPWKSHFAAYDDYFLNFEAEGHANSKIQVATIVEHLSILTFKKKLYNFALFFRI